MGRIGRIGSSLKPSFSEKRFRENSLYIVTLANSSLIYLPSRHNLAIPRAPKEAMHSEIF